MNLLSQKLLKFLIFGIRNTTAVFLSLGKHLILIDFDLTEEIAFKTGSSVILEKHKLFAFPETLKFSVVIFSNLIF